METSPPPKVKDASKPRKRFIGKAGKPSTKSGAHVVSHQIPADVLEDPLLNEAIRQLPPNYSFEIHKTVHQIRKHGAKMVALQMPEGLLMFACTIADIVERFTDVLTVIMGDVTYGACCIDDYTAAALGCDMLIHYGHSCLVPIDTTTIKTLYVFVEIAIDGAHLVNTIRTNFPSDRARFREKVLVPGSHSEGVAPGTQLAGLSRLQLEQAPTLDPPGQPPSQPELLPSVHISPTKFALVSTIQFVAAVQSLHDNLLINLSNGEQQPLSEGPAGLTTGGHSIAGSSNSSSSLHLGRDGGKYDVVIPRAKPLSPGELLGCTAPRLAPDVDALIYVGDGRFHLESIMIMNPEVPAFRYDPYSKKLTRERYDHEEMKSLRMQAVRTARKNITACSSSDEQPLWGVVLGTLGRQGNFKQLQHIMHQLASNSIPIPFMPILISELSPAKLSLFPSDHISTFVQTSCPRLSIDWGYAFTKPLLSPYEASITVGAIQSWEDEGDVYPMDFYDANGKAALARRVGARVV
ncbi:Diphthamide biosynthesis protein 1 [Tulasnella sp. JGI-2019a]|nr:Diphthamide biosynthesis protein 1 [Tulasnella sp. JGI-2019a]